MFYCRLIITNMDQFQSKAISMRNLRSMARNHYSRSERNKQEALVRRANSQRERMLRNRNAAFEIRASKNRMKNEQKTRRERNKAIALTIRRQRLEEEECARSLKEAAIATYCLAIENDIPLLLQMSDCISGTTKEEVNLQ